jgi:hypothetical protein
VVWIGNPGFHHLGGHCVLAGPCCLAARKGHSFFGYFLFSLVFFPAALIVAYMSQDRTALA